MQRFDVNPGLLASARERLAGRDDLFWLIGASCTGKSTLSRAIAAEKGIARYDMDAQIYGNFGPAYSPDRHPASTAWFSAENPFAWALSLSPDEFDDLNRAANAEYLDLLADDLETRDLRGPLLIDGGITHPAVLVEAIPPRQIFCLEIDEEQRLACWEESPERAAMRDWVRDLPDPAGMWVHFLALDKLISDTIGAESRQKGIATLRRRPGQTVDELVETIAAHFGLISPNSRC